MTPCSTIPILIAPLAAFLIGLCAVPTVRRMALACGFLDNPDRRRKLHGAPIALGGGIAVWLATWSGWGVSLFGSAFQSQLRGIGDAGWFLAALGLATFLILGLGIIDDRSGMRARHKLAGQVVAAVILVSLGLRIDAWSCFGVELKLGIFAYPVTVFWILLVVNAFNLIDGMDGFCGSLGLVASLAIAFLAYSRAESRTRRLRWPWRAHLAAFLGFNLPPAKIYLGDAGSMTIGLMISALSVRSCTDERQDRRRVAAGDGAPDVAAAGHRDRGRPALAQGPLDLRARPRTHSPLPEKSPRGSPVAALGRRLLAGDARGRRGRVGDDVWHGRLRRPALPSPSPLACCCAPIPLGRPSRGSCSSGPRVALTPLSAGFGCSWTRVSARSVTSMATGTGRVSGTPWSAKARPVESGASSWRST